MHGADPEGGVFAPEDDAVAEVDGAAHELEGEAVGSGEELGVGGGIAADSPVLDDGCFLAVAAEVVEERDEGFPHVGPLGACWGLPSLMDIVQ